MTDVTLILGRIEQGEPHAAEELLPLVYDELRKLAAAKMALERPGQTLQATALVHEAYIRLVDTEKVQHWNSRRHFFSAAAEAMRRILIASARRRKCAKRGGGQSPMDVSIDDIAAPVHSDRLLALDEALTKLAAKDPVKAELVKLRYFAGFSVEEAAAALQISPATAGRYWAYARAWLQQDVTAREGQR
jgi:RNA polymerase sigma factor (TIGR02999 family)